MQKILVYGLGNPYRCDDAVGIKVAELLEQSLQESNVTITHGTIDGLAMLDEILGYDYVIFIDSVKTKNGIPGELYRIPLFPLQEIPSLSVSHGIDFVTAIRLGKKFGYKMPKRIDVYAIEIQDNKSFSEQCTPVVQEVIPHVVDCILKEVKAQNRHDSRTH